MGEGSLLNNLSSAIGEFLALRTDNFKKSIIEGMSTGFSRLLVILIISLLMLIVLALFAFGFILLLGEVIGSISGAVFIIGSIILTGIAIIFLLRKRLFKKMFTNLFTDIMDTESPEDKWKSMVLSLVRSLRTNL